MLAALGNDLTAANSAITKLTGNLANTDKALAQKPMRPCAGHARHESDAAGKTLENRAPS